MRRNNLAVMTYGLTYLFVSCSIPPPHRSIPMFRVVPLNESFRYLLVKRILFFTLVGLLLCISGPAQQPAAGPPLPDFRAEVRFHFRERVPDAEPGEKNVTAPSYNTEELPASQFLSAQNQRVIQGKVPHLPFIFFLRLTRQDQLSQPLLEVNVVDSDPGKSLQGFPTQTADLSEEGVDFDIPLSDSEAQDAKGALDGDDSAFITYVQLLVRFPNNGH